jgi:soluble lytic murein transglycosylase-like protein
MALVAITVLTLCSGACARQVRPAERVRPPLQSDSAEPAHDPADDWRGDRQLVAIGPSPRRAAPAIEPAPPPRQLREFTDEEAQRIRRVQRIVHAAARARDLPPDLVNGIIWVESKFIPRARGRKGPRGLMQLMPRTGRELARQLNRRYVPFDPDFNIHAGTYYFWRMVSRYDGNLTLALAAYNIGPAVVDGWVRDGLPLADASRRYVDNVFTAARAFRDRGL